MLEQVKEILIANYNKKIAEFDSIKIEIDALEDMIVNDNSEENYKNSLKEIKKLKKNSEEYKTELEKINNIYNQGLLNFENVYNKYSDLRKQASRIDIYGYNRKITRVENAASLDDLNIDEEKANKIISGELEDF